MIDIIKVACLVLVASIFAVYLKQQKREFATIFTIVVCIIILLFLATPIVDTFQKFYEIVSGYNIDGAYILIIAKVIGISYITAITTNLANDCGETAIGTKMDIAGKIAIIICTFPAIQNIMEQISILVK